MKGFMTQSYFDAPQCFSVGAPATGLGAYQVAQIHTGLKFYGAETSKRHGHLTDWPGVASVVEQSAREL
jgi:hypothetical protein